MSTWKPFKCHQTQFSSFMWFQSSPAGHCSNFYLSCLLVLNEGQFILHCSGINWPSDKSLLKSFSIKWKPIRICHLCVFNASLLQECWLLLVIFHQVHSNVTPQTWVTLVYFMRLQRCPHSLPYSAAHLGYVQLFRYPVVVKYMQAHKPLINQIIACFGLMHWM